MGRGATESSRRSVTTFKPGTDWSGCRSVVSLHAHTHHSREVMSDLPPYIARIPFVAAFFQRELDAYQQDKGHAIDFSKGWWHPPVTPRTVFESEVEQIERRFGLASMVSITDHDNINAGLDLQELYAKRRAPISFEWTVPHGAGFFHLGVHNLPPESAGVWFTRLMALTMGRDGAESRQELMAALNECRDTLLIFNHPMWDLAGVGEDEHTRLLARFMTEHGSALHALELNGYRSKWENEGTRRLAHETVHPVISGGDRHACAPNAIVNVTSAQSFSEFADEVRHGVSHVVFMPEYQESLVVRKLASAYDILRDYPTYPAGRRRWTDRVSCDWQGAVRPLSYHWPDGGPLWVRSSVNAFRAITNPLFRPVLQAAIQTVEGRGPVDRTTAVSEPVRPIVGLSETN